MAISEQSQQRQFAANLTKYMLYVALKGFGFGLFLSAWVIYLQERRGLTLAQAALIDATFFLAAAFGEVPTGIIADKVGRKASLVIGAVLLNLAAVGWTFAPTLPLIMVAYVAMGIGMTFLSGAEDALFYESAQRAGQGNDYTRLVGRAGAIFTGAIALGSAAGGFLATLDLVLPYVVFSFIFLILFFVVLTFREPRTESATGQLRKGFGQIFGESLALMRTHPALRYTMIYLALMPIASMMIEALFLQPQAVALGVPLAGIGLIIMAVQIVNAVAAGMANQVKTRFGEQRVVYAAPVVIVAGLLFLSAFQYVPALAIIGVMGFFTAILRPILLGRIQAQVSDDLRATIISMLSLMFTIIAGLTQPTLAFIADQTSLPTAYVVLAGSLGLLVGGLLWISRRYFPVAAEPAVIEAPPTVSAEMVPEATGR